ncbi:MAG: DoxX family membrane protein [Bdellovibrionales bacterium]|nr:DoxX family membrane protein [Bdellovibrionales bacterium]
MKTKMPIVARIILGLIFFVFGLNGFFHFIPMPAEVPEKIMTFMGGLMSSGFFIPLLKGTEVVCGALLIVGAFVPLALVVLAPIILNIFLTHAFLDPNAFAITLATVIGLLEIYLAFFAILYSDIVKQLFQLRSFK